MLNVYVNNRNRGRYIWASNGKWVVVRCWQPDNDIPQVEFVYYKTPIDELQDALTAVLAHPPRCDGGE